jgi:hypothetical protein
MTAPFPDEKLVKSTVPLLCKCVGGFFCVGGVVAALIGCLLYIKGQAITPAVLVLLAVGLLDIVTGVCVIFLFPKFLISRHDALAGKRYR